MLRPYVRARLATTTIDPIRSREVRPMLRRLELGKGDSVLDVGCASGVWTHHLGRRAARVVGVDSDEDALAWGRRVYPAADLRQADARALPFADGEFDKVVFISTLEHIPRPAEALDEVARVLKPGGRLAISVDTLDHPAWRSVRDEHARRAFVAEYFTRERLLELAGERGLELVWGRYLYGNRLAPVLLRPRLESSNLHWLLAPAVRLSGALLDDADSGLMFQSVMRVVR